MPVGVSVNGISPPNCTVAVVGEMERVGGGAVVTVTVAVTDFVGSAWLIAVRIAVPAVTGAVYSPVWLIEPFVVDQVTTVFAEPVTVAMNCCVSPACTVAVVGETETTIAGAATVTLAVAEALPPSPVHVSV